MLGVREISNKWLASYLSNRKQFIRLMVTNQIYLMSNVGCLKRPYWDLFCVLFILTIYMQQLSILKCATFQMILTFQTSCVKSINKQVIYDPNKRGKWLKANKISLYVGKTELAVFTSPRKHLHCDLKIKLNGKRLYETDSVKQL